MTRLRVDDLMTIYGVSQATVSRWARNGRLPKPDRMPGKPMSWDDSAIVAWNKDGRASSCPVGCAPAFPVPDGVDKADWLMELAAASVDILGLIDSVPRNAVAQEHRLEYAVMRLIVDSYGSLRDAAR